MRLQVVVDLASGIIYGVTKVLLAAGMQLKAYMFKGLFNADNNNTHTEQAPLF